MPAFESPFSLVPPPAPFSLPAVPPFIAMPGMSAISPLAPALSDAPAPVWEATESVVATALSFLQPSESSAVSISARNAMDRERVIGLVIL